MKIDPPTARVLVTFGVVTLVALLLGAILVRPRDWLKPDRSTRAFELDEPPQPAR